MILLPRAKELHCVRYDRIALRLAKGSLLVESSIGPRVVDKRRREKLIVAPLRLKELIATIEPKH